MYSAFADELVKIAAIHQLRLEMEKVANDPTLSEMEKEALLRQLKEVGQALVGAPVKLKVGDEIVEVAGNRALPRVPGYKETGKKLQEAGELLKGPKSMTPEEAKAIGIQTGVGSRIAGEAAGSAGHHMEHASTVGKALNPLGKPFGGAIEGVTRGVGKELERGAEGARAAVGRGLQRAAPHVGTAGEIVGAAGTATALGSAVSPMAAGLAGGLKSMGVYAPLKAKLGLGGLNVAKDVAATGVEKGIEAGRRFLPRAVGALRGAAAAA
jgi:hypothetical protein